MAERPDLSPDSAYLRALQEEAERDGRRIVVGAVIVDSDGRAFVHRRAPDRRLFPNCWDIAGGHLEPGETIHAALAREIFEETGWRLRAITGLIEMFDWETEYAGVVTRRREFDFLANVDGDLSHPRLELGKATEFRWVSLAEIEILKEHAPPGYAVHRIVKHGLARYHTR
jgi:8-oxo-dGTP diphosphatase